MPSVLPRTPRGRVSQRHGNWRLYRLDVDAKPTTYIESIPGIGRQAFGPDGTRYVLVPTEKKIIAIQPGGTRRTFSEGIVGHCIFARHDGTLFVSEQGEHSDMTSRIWQVDLNGQKSVVDEGLLCASGVAFAPDGGLFFAAEKSTKWIYSYVVQSDGSFVISRPFIGCT